MQTRFLTAISSVALALAPMVGPAMADDAGKDQFVENCASCHGMAGLGDGPMAEFMSVKLPDLTTITQRNDGVFPTLAMIHVIDGRSGLRGHGSEMPIWGTQFSASAGSGVVGDYSSVYAARGQVLSIVYYLESIQK